MFPVPECLASLPVSDPVDITNISSTHSATLEGKPGEVLAAGWCNY